MSREDIIRMAFEAGFAEHETPAVKIATVEKFAALIAEDCAKRCEAVADGEELPAAAAAADRCSRVIREAYKP